MKIIYLQIFAVLLFFSSCKNQLNFQTTESGLEYAFVEENDTNLLPKIGDGLVVDMKFYWNDSLLFNTREVALDYRIHLIESAHDGSIYEGFAMMHIGDSAIFKIDAYKFYQLTSALPSPDCIHKGDKLIFYVRLINIMTAEDIQREFERIQRMKLKNEQDLLNDYLISNDVDLEVKGSGIYINEIKKGTGKTPQIGDSITLHYEGTLINNEPFDSSIMRGKPFSFVFGDSSLMKGWTEGIGMMQEGGKATIIIPSNLAYGERGVGEVIPPYSTVIFEINLLKVKRN
jgi:FKBP-type peptidyl-prolyl cis-trans isomerase FkpA